MKSIKQSESCKAVKPFPKLMYLSIIKSTSSIALMTDKRTGTVVHAGDGFNTIGKHCTNLNASCMSDYDGSICLNN